MSKIITRLFDTLADAEHAVLELEKAGIPESDISLVSLKLGNRNTDTAAALVATLNAVGINKKEADIYARSILRGTILVNAKVADATYVEVERALMTAPPGATDLNSSWPVGDVDSTPHEPDEAPIENEEVLEERRLMPSIPTE